MEEKKNNAVEKVENIIREKNYTKEEGLSYEEQKRATEEKIKAKKLREKKGNQKAEKRGLIVAIISLGIATLVLSSILTFTFLMPSASDKLLENNYQRAFYDTVSQVNNMDLNLSKTIATKDEKAIQKYLMDLAINSELAESNIQQLPLHDQNKYYTGKLINQIGDFAKYLNKKLINGESLSSSDRTSLQALYKANLVLKDSLSKSRENMDENFSFNTMKEGEDNVVLENFNQLENLSVEYPELIYDGPFSDAKEQKQILGLKGEEINENYAKDIFIKIFNQYNPKDIAVESKTSGKIESYSVNATVKEKPLYAQISKVGGKLIMFEYEGSCEDTSYEENSALEKSLEFLSSVGFKDMEVVWKNYSDNVYTFNFCYSKDGVIMYPDMVKVRVCAQTNMIIGLEAESYYYNHTERVLAKPQILESQAREFVFDQLDVIDSKIAVVKIGEKTEKLCYEFSGTYEGSIYYVYIDAINGRQIEMFKVISSTDGSLLM